MKTRLPHDWEPMADAPRDGTAILLRHEADCFPQPMVGWWARFNPRRDDLPAGGVMCWHTHGTIWTGFMHDGGSPDGHFACWRHIPTAHEHSLVVRLRNQEAAIKDLTRRIECLTNIRARRQPNTALQLEAKFTEAYKLLRAGRTDPAVWAAIITPHVRMIEAAQERYQLTNEVEAFHAVAKDILAQIEENKIGEIVGHKMIHWLMAAVVEMCGGASA